MSETTQDATEGAQEVKWYSDVRVERGKDSTATIYATVPDEAVKKLRPRAIKALGEHMDFPGFRKGHAPETLIVERIGEPAILEDVAHLALERGWPQILASENLDVVGRPEVSITKLAPGNPITYTVRVTLYPEFTLPDYRALADKVVKSAGDPSKEVATDEEVNHAIEDLRTRFAKPSEIVQPDGTKGEPIKPELTDDFVRTLGEFADVADFKVKLAEQLTKDKQRKAHEKRRIEIADALIDKTKVVVPELFIESELEQMVREFEHNVTRMGLTMEQYLEHAKKSIEEIRKEWHGDAEKRAKLQLVLGEIAKKESVLPDHAKVEREVSHIKEHYSEADEHAVRSYVMQTMVNEQVFEMLEGKNADTRATDLPAPAVTGYGKASAE